MSTSEDHRETLKAFLNMPLWTSNSVFDKFIELGNHVVFRQAQDNRLQRFLYCEGERKNKVVLVAHADTVFDEEYGGERIEHNVVENREIFSGRDKDGNETAIGADDRAGCAILWLLRESGHSVLLTDGEERGGIGSYWLMNDNPDIAQKINEHQFMIQFDRRNSNDFKCYDVGTPEFRNFIEEKTGYREPDRSSYTDICTLCRDICGVNFSIGYYGEHTPQETLNFNEWQNTLNMAIDLIGGELPRFIRKQSI